MLPALERLKACDVPSAYPRLRHQAHEELRGWRALSGLRTRRGQPGHKVGGGASLSGIPERPSPGALPPRAEADSP